MDIIVHPSALCGNVHAIASKTVLHRAIICALQSRSVCEISPIIYSADVRATLDAAAALGADITERANSVTIDATDAFHNGRAAISCGESGSTLRFMLSIAAANGITTDFSGKGRLPERPISQLRDQLSAHDILFSNDTLPFSITGQLKSGDYTLAGDVSSQYISSLLMALPTLDGESRLYITTQLQSRPYVEMTIDVLRRFGVVIEKTDYGYRIGGSQRFYCERFMVEGDWSNASCFLAAAALGSNVTVDGLNEHSLQGDSAFAALAGRSEIDVSDTPDLVPALCVVAAARRQTTRFINAGRLRIKESDRIASVCNALNAMGVATVQSADSFTVYGGQLRGGIVDCCNDHRIAMAFSVLASIAQGDTTLSGCECVNKSYPHFYEDFKKIGGELDVINR